MSGWVPAVTCVPIPTVVWYMSLKRETGFAISGRQLEEHLPHPTQLMKPKRSYRYLPFLKYLCRYLVGLVGRKFSPDATFATSSSRHPSQVRTLSPLSSVKSGLSFTSKQ